MNSNDLSVLVPWVINHGYLIFWVVATIEGPITTIAAGIAASLGYFNIFIIMALALAGDLGGDLLYYGIGYISYNVIRSPFFRYLGLNEKRLGKIESLLHTRPNRAVFFIKISPVVGPIGIIGIGATRLKFKKFFWPALCMAIPKSLFFVLLGFYSGEAYAGLNRVIADGQTLAIWGIAVVVVVYLIYLKVVNQISKKMIE
ncbi:MAG: VTT domain-containing protein [Candidatus Falkowbacteria bacterium]|nr:VTT domain-containing protein [Candidatus Falkowbacteria bacterium]